MSAFRVGLLIFIAIVLGYNRVQAENLETGKSAQKLFSNNCSTCHSDPRGLSSHMSKWALTEFLREHYTASQTAASELAVPVGSSTPRAAAMNPNSPGQMN
jgi:hypothetical protein